MEKYIGTKIVLAEPENKADGREGYAIGYSDGYQSWSPKDTFEKAYRRTEGMTFGLAIEAMKQENRVSRPGWNGKGMWLRIVIPGDDSNNLDVNLGMECLPYIEMKTADNKLVPWLASQTDMLAEDWAIIV